MVVPNGEFRISLHTDREGTVRVQSINEYMRTETQKRWESIQNRVYRTGRLEPRAFRFLRGGNRVCGPKTNPAFLLALLQFNSFFASNTSRKSLQPLVPGTS